MQIVLWVLAVIGLVATSCFMSFLVFVCWVYLSDFARFITKKVKIFKLRYMNHRQKNVRVCVRSKSQNFSDAAESALRSELEKYKIGLRSWKQTRVNFRARAGVSEMAYNMSRRIESACGRKIPVVFAQVFVVWDEPFEKGRRKRSLTVAWVGARGEGYPVSNKEEWYATSPIVGSIINPEEFLEVVPHLVKQTVGKIVLEEISSPRQALDEVYCSI